MNKQNLEITTSVVSIIILIVLIIISHSLFINDSTMQSYAFVASFTIYVLIISAIGLKLINIE